MACPSSYPITLADVRAEFGGAVGTSLGAYVRGGAYVPNIGANASVPTSVPITLGNMLGSTAAVYGATLSPTYLSKVRVGTGIVDSNPCTTTVTGSAGSLTYLWTKVSGGAITINNATSATTTFRANFISLGSRTAYFKCTVTDSILGTTSTSNVQVDLEAS